MADPQTSLGPLLRLALRLQEAGAFDYAGGDRSIAAGIERLIQQRNEAREFQAEVERQMALMEPMLAKAALDQEAILKLQEAHMAQMQQIADGVTQLRAEKDEAVSRVIDVEAAISIALGDRDEAQAERDEMRQALREISEAVRGRPEQGDPEWLSWKALPHRVRAVMVRLSALQAAQAPDDVSTTGFASAPPGGPQAAGSGGSQGRADAPLPPDLPMPAGWSQDPWLMLADLAPEDVVVRQGQFYQTAWLWGASVTYGNRLELDLDVPADKDLTAGYFRGHRGLGKTVAVRLLRREEPTSRTKGGSDA